MTGKLLGAIGGLAALAVMTTVGAAQAQDFEPSAEEFQISCAPCHGADAMGNGPLARESTGAIDAPDLTEMSKNNGGKFPLPLVFMTIDGRNQIGAHGDRKMPVWGDRYLEQAEEKGLSGSSGTNAVRARVLELVYYLQSIQTVHIPSPPGRGN